MKVPSIEKLSRFAWVAVLATLSVGCATNVPSTSPCPAKYSTHYADTVRGFSLCLPAGVKNADSGGRVTFTGFAVPTGTNLQQKTLVVAAGNYEFLPGAKPAGSITAGGVVLTRAQIDEGSAGHSTLHVIYTWKKAGKAMHFDFTHRAVNVGNFDPPNRPKEYDQAAQIKLSGEIMATFQPLK